jgi:hypothetical protein
MEDQARLDGFGSLSLETAGMRVETREGFERVDARAVARLVEWSETIDRIIADRDKAIADLRRRIEKLEGKN